MTFDEYCEVRQEPGTLRAKWLWLKYRWEQWKKSHRPMFIIRYPLLGFGKPWAYYKAQNLQRDLEKLEQMAGIGITVSKDLGRERSVNETMDECQVRLTHILTAVRERREKRVQRQRAKMASA